VDYATLNRGLWDREDRTRAQRARFARECIGRGKLVLENGCANGESGARLVRDNRLIGMDIVEEYARAVGPAYSGRLVGNAIELPFLSARFDGVVAAEFIEHLTIADGRRFLAEAHRVLRGGSSCSRPRILPTGARSCFEFRSPAELTCMSTIRKSGWIKANQSESRFPTP